MFCVSVQIVNATDKMYLFISGDIWNQLEKYNALHGSHTKPKLSLFQFLMKQSKGGTYGENEPIRGERVGEKS